MCTSLFRRKCVREGKIEHVERTFEEMHREGTRVAGACLASSVPGHPMLCHTAPLSRRLLWAHSPRSPDLSCFLSPFHSHVIGGKSSTAGQRVGNGAAISAGKQRADAARASLSRALEASADLPAASAAVPSARRAQQGDLMRLSRCGLCGEQSEPKLFGGKGPKGQWQCRHRRGGKTCSRTLYCAQCGLGGAACKRRNEAQLDPPCFSAVHFLG